MRCGWKDVFTVFTQALLDLVWWEAMGDIDLEAFFEWGCREGVPFDVWQFWQSAVSMEFSMGEYREESPIAIPSFFAFISSRCPTSSISKDLLFAPGQRGPIPSSLLRDLQTAIMDGQCNGRINSSSSICSCRRRRRGRRKRTSEPLAWQRLVRQSTSFFVWGLPFESLIIGAFVDGVLVAVGHYN